MTGKRTQPTRRRGAGQPSGTPRRVNTTRVPGSRPSRPAASGAPQPSGGLPSWVLPVLLGGAVIVVGFTVIALVVAFATRPSGSGATPTGRVGATSTLGTGANSSPGGAVTPRPSVGPPDATPLANPPSQPSGSGTTVTISTSLGKIVIAVYDQSSPVAGTNFINLAAAGFYDGTVFHRIVPGFVIQGGDPTGTGNGGPGYSIQDEPVVGEYSRGIVAMARSSAPNSQGSQFFIVLDDSARSALAARTYAIIGNVVQGMDVVDQIAAGPNSGSPKNTALLPVTMTRVTVQQP